MHPALRACGLALALALAVPPAHAARRPPKKPAAARPATPDGPAISPATFKVERHKLANGLVVLTHEDHSVPAVTFWQWFKVGSRNERPGITGISHYFEHMMFNGSKNVPPKEYDRILESNGGYSNAFTDRDMTGYYEDIASDRMDVLFRLDSDRMASLSLLPEQLESEIEVVKEERRLRTDNDIAGMLDEQLYAAAFLASPYRWPVVGWMGDLERITRDDCVAYFRTYYAPNNCILILTGDFDTQTALGQIEKFFGSIPAQAPPTAPVDSEPEQRGERRAEVHYPAENVSFQVGYKVPSVESSDVAVLDVLSSILSDGESSRLHQDLVYRKQIALDVSSFFRTRLAPTLFELYVEMKPGRSAAEGEAALYAVLDTLAMQGPAPRELEKAKNLLEASFVKSLKTNNGVGEQLGFHEHVFGDHAAMFRAIDRYRAVTAEDCRRVAQKYFVPLRRTVAVLVPEAEPAAKAQPCVPDTTPDWMTSVPPTVSSAQVRPADCATVEQTPPDFSWPDLSRDARYEVTLTYPDGSSRTLAAPQNWINWDEVLPAGSYAWQVEVTSSSGAEVSRPRRFTVSANAVPFLVPDWSVLFERAVAKQRPRALPDVATVQAIITERQADLEVLLSRVAGKLADPLPAEPVSASSEMIKLLMDREGRRALEAAQPFLHAVREHEVVRIVERVAAHALAVEKLFMLL